MRTNSSCPRAHRRSVLAAALFTLASLVALLPLAAPALAGTITNDRPLLFGFDGSDTTDGAFSRLEAMAVDYSSGSVYVFNTVPEDHGALDKFNSNGEAQNFAATGESSLDGSTTPAGEFKESFRGPDVAVDNSAVNPGRIYVSDGLGSVFAFDPAGNYLWTLTDSTGQGEEPCGVSVDAEGHLWTVEREAKKALEFASSGSPPAQIGTISLAASNEPCRPEFDHAGNLYIAGNWRANPTGIQKYVGGSFDSTLAVTGALDVAVDQSIAAGHTFAAFNTASFPFGEHGFAEFDSSGSPVGSFPQAELLGHPRAIAYNPALDRLYVADEHRLEHASKVKAFGPIASGTVPDVTTQASDGITRTSAILHGTINPQSVPNSYHFEWTPGGNQTQEVVQHNAEGGTFKLGVGEESTEPLPFTVSPQAMQSALEGLAQIGAGNVTVTGTPSAGSSAKEEDGTYKVMFVGALQGSVVRLIGDGSDLTSKFAHGLTVREPKSVPDWSIAKSVPVPFASVEPTDSKSHPVSLTLGELETNTTYSVRLVGTNTESGLSAYSSIPKAFKTLPPPLPIVTLSPPSAITTSSAHVSGTVNPQEDVTTWKVLRKALAGASKAECEALKEGEFEEAKEGTIAKGEVGSVSIEADLTGLLPAQTNCVRIAATNGGGTTNADASFITHAIVPSEASAAFAAPRADTTARINARVNPEGEADIAYRFELSEDGTNWTVLPERESSVDGREQIVIADELVNLKPDTTYHYRLGSVENEVGPVPSLGGEKLFTTRTTAEMNPPARGVELVNSPDKGNQNVLVRGLGVGYLPVSANGEDVIWSTVGGAPGGTTGSQNAFLARRTPSGWLSQSLIPPAAQQVGGGSFIYHPEAVSPDFAHFAFTVAESKVVEPYPEKPTVVRLDDSQHQDILGSYDIKDTSFNTRSIDLSDDGDHVLLINPVTAQLEDVGSGSPEVVSVMPDGTQSKCPLEAKQFLETEQWHPGYHTIATSDASRVYFVVRKKGQCASGLLGLYVRNRETGKTTQIDLGAFGKSPEFIRADTDGRSAYFLTASKLDPADTNEHGDVYRWDEEAAKSTCLTCEADPDVNVLAGTNGYTGVQVSNDFSHVYFESEDRLVPGQGKQGDANIYALSRGAISFVADPDEAGLLGSGRETDLSSDGNVLLFKATASPRLTADATPSECAIPVEPFVGGCKELYRYDDRDGSLECISCRHGGATTNAVGSAAGIDNFRQSADGSTVAFATKEALVQLDVNRDSDIYAWRNGAIRLLTDGVSPEPLDLGAPQVVGADRDGTNLFFALVPPEGGLTGFEQDGLLNLYDARIGGGFEPPNPPVHCSEESCQGSLQAAPSSDRSASAGFDGSGNQREPKPSCRKGRVRRQGRCVSRHPHKHRRHKRATDAKQGGPR